jgi:hypothetical protein
MGKAHGARSVPATGRAAPGALDFERSARLFQDSGYRAGRSKRD